MTKAQLHYNVCCMQTTHSRKTNVFHFLLGGPISPAPWRQVELWPCVKWYTYAEGCLDCVSPCEQHSRLKSPSSCYSCSFSSFLVDATMQTVIAILLHMARCFAALIVFLSLASLEIILEPECSSRVGGFLPENLCHGVEFCSTLMASVLSCLS